MSFNVPDSIIPDPSNPQDFNRYAYARYNPLKYSDPTGHCSVAAMERGECTAKELYSKHPKPRAVDKVKGFVGNYEWVNPPDNDFYEYFVQGVGEFEDISTMNCWETVLLGAYEAGEVDSKWIKEFYTDAMSSSDPNQTIWDQLGASNATSTDKYEPEKGDVVFYTNDGSSYPGHVALSLGEGEVISLWFGPDDVNSVQITTTDKLVELMKDTFGVDSVSVTAGEWPPSSK